MERMTMAVQAAIAFVWLGMVLAISFLEAPLKFRAPGITVPLGVGIGRLVFRALNIVEGIFALALVAFLVPQRPVPILSLALIVALCLVLIAGAAVLRPVMDRRVRVGRLADGVPRHSLHWGYVALECLKVVLLIVLGVASLAG